MPVFISGTFVDMESWRNEVMGTINDCGKVAKDLARRSVVAEKTIEFIERELESSDTYLGIFGVRYGERVDGNPDAPSWTHYEFLYFSELCQRDWHGRGLPPLLAFVPDKGSTAHEEITQAAKKVLKNLSPTEARKDLAAQDKFLRSIREGGVHTDREGAERLEFFGLRHDTSCRLINLFRYEDELKYKVKELLLIFENQKLKNERLENIQPNGQSAPLPIKLPSISKLDVDRLRQAGNARALCVVTQPLAGSATANQIARALHQANPFDSENIDKFIEIKEERIGNHLSEEDVVTLFNEAIAGEVDFQAADKGNYMSELAQWIVDEDQTITVRITLPNLPVFRNGTKFKTMFWQPLQQAIFNTAQTGKKTDYCALLLIVAIEKVISDGAKKQHYQELTGKTFENFERPFLMSIPAEAIKTPEQKQRTQQL